MAECGEVLDSPLRVLARLPPSAFVGATRGASYASRFPVVCCRCPEGAESPFLRSHRARLWEAAAPHLHVHERVGLAATLCSEDRHMMAVPMANPATNGRARRDHRRNARRAHADRRSGPTPASPTSRARLPCTSPRISHTSASLRLSLRTFFPDKIPDQDGGASPTTFFFQYGACV